MDLICRSVIKLCFLQVEIECMSTKDMYTFLCNKWLASDEEGYTIVREMPAQGPGIETPLTCKLCITVIGLKFKQ